MAKAQHDLRYGTVPVLLKKMREEAGLTQRDMGGKLGKPQSWVYNCETANRRVDIAEFTAWCRVCGIKPEEGFRRYLKG